jgi:hypothetical protein
MNGSFVSASLNVFVVGSYGVMYHQPVAGNGSWFRANRVTHFTAVCALSVSAVDVPAVVRNFMDTGAHENQETEMWFAVGEDGAIFAHAGFWPHMAWIRCDSGTRAHLKAVCASGKDVVAVGEGGTVVVSHDLGDMWLQYRTRFTVNDLTCCTILSDKPFHFACGDERGFLYSTKNAYQSFTSQEFMEDQFMGEEYKTAKQFTDIRSALASRTGLWPFLSKYMVGLDWVGDEDAHPFCVLAARWFVELANAWPKPFGIRIHSGENVFRASTVEDREHVLNKNFHQHMKLMARIVTYIREHVDARVKMRIGHGLAYLHWGHDHILNYAKEKDICIELNPTSNRYLVGDTFQSEARSPNVGEALSQFLRRGVPVVLATDNDGIWPLDNCPHRKHVSLAHEFCQGIVSGAIDNKSTLEEIVETGNRVRFDIKSQPREGKDPDVSIQEW